MKEATVQGSSESSTHDGGGLVSSCRRDTETTEDTNEWSQDEPKEALALDQSKLFDVIRDTMKKFVWEEMNWWDLINPHKPWILVGEEGSFKNAFDTTPEVFRKGPWNVLVCMFLSSIVYLALLSCVYSFFVKKAAPPSTDYNQAFSLEWWYNLAGFLWTTMICWMVIQRGPGWYTWIAYTLQTWTLITVQHGLSVFIPFFPALKTIHERLRLPMLTQSTITFVLWNFVLMPIILLNMDSPAKRKEFLAIFHNFTITQLHVVHMVLATIQGVWASPHRTLDFTDLSVTNLLALQYAGLYLLVLDRLGIHLYVIFSPRTLLAPVTYLVGFAANCGCFFLWRYVIDHYSRPLE